MNTHSPTEHVRNPTYKLKQSDLKLNFLIFRLVSFQEGALRMSESSSPCEGAGIKIYHPNPMFASLIRDRLLN